MRNHCRPTMRACWSPSARRRSISKPSPKAGTASCRKLGDQRIVWAPEQGRPRVREFTGVSIQLGSILDLIKDGTISGKIAKDLFEIIWSEGGDPRAIVEQRGMKQVTDLGAIEKVVDEIIAKNPDKVADQVQSESDRLVRRSSDEVIRRQGKPAGGQRHPQTKLGL